MRHLRLLDNTITRCGIQLFFFEWRQSQTKQAICGKANSSLDATLVISAAALINQSPQAYIVPLNTGTWI